ncbi:hypothetical protein ABH930_001980 [Kitasatospora sp. GAS204A]|uniref:DUF6087 family protein n=1 Tax=unclassified Kitasatospora TaxID=2633591 RepID=UPI00247451D9|nr:DUF6087 family protein [Kitasatospora sp. GAS204B]MDH6116157.1 hypothetical protein [Kitasatospora sp. GAS204B]
MDESEEPLELWAARRDALRRKVGERRVSHADGVLRASHVDPAAPRVVEEWDGVQWVVVGATDGYAAAQRAFHGITGDGVMRGMMPRPESTGLRNPTVAGRGRHRKP